MSIKLHYQFESLFRENFPALCGFANKYLRDLEESKNVVHEVFIALWQKMETLPTDTNYRAYLYTSVRNRCLNHLRDQKKIVPISDHHSEEVSLENHALETEELEHAIEWAINNLPEKCRVVFELSRFEGLKYQQIAEKLNISVKTVEGRMTRALTLLRSDLSDFLVIVILFLLIQGCSMGNVLM